VRRNGSGSRPRAATRGRRFRWALLWLLLLPLLSGSQILQDPIELKIIGYIDASEAQVNPWAMLDVWIEEPPDRKFALTNIIVLSAGAISGGDILAEIRPIRPNIIFNGDKELLEKISSAKPNQRLEIRGTTAFGPRRILVQSVERSAPITGPTPTPTLGQRLLGD
jgi:hypothetical protein